jgi:hypothetical protein
MPDKPMAKINKTGINRAASKLKHIVTHKNTNAKLK